MPFDPTIPPDPEGQDDAWDSLDLAGADVESTEADVVARENKRRWMRPMRWII